LAADAARRTPEWWAEMHRKAREIRAGHLANVDPKHDAVKARLAEKRDAMRDRLTALNIERQADA
jgi:hypothetical protein